MADDLRQKLVILAERVEDKKLTLLEAIRVELRAQKIEVADRSKVRKALAESLEVSEGTVLVKLAAYNDSDRILDDIVNTLNNDD
jgi:hypothetical protein